MSSKFFIALMLMAVINFPQISHALSCDLLTDQEVLTEHFENDLYGNNYYIQVAQGEIVTGFWVAAKPATDFSLPDHTRYGQYGCEGRPHTFTVRNAVVYDLPAEWFLELGNGYYHLKFTSSNIENSELLNFDESGELIDEGERLLHQRKGNFFRIEQLANVQSDEQLMQLRAEKEVRSEYLELVGTFKTLYFEWLYFLAYFPTLFATAVTLGGYVFARKFLRLRSWVVSGGLLLLLLFMYLFAFTIGFIIIA